MSGDSGGVQSNDELSFEVLTAAWRSLKRSPLDVHSGVPGHWRAAFTQMSEEVVELRNQSLWRGGKRTLLHAMGIHHREIYLTAGLAWLLDPDGWHLLGSGVLRGLMDTLHLDTPIAYPVLISTEEARSDGETRADLVIRLPDVTILIEVKVFAGEQAEQCDRLAQRWAEEAPTLVFLTRDGHPPRTSVISAGRWTVLTWADIAQTVRAAIGQAPTCAPGAKELLSTIEELVAEEHRAKR